MEWRLVIIIVSKRDHSRGGKEALNKTCLEAIWKVNAPYSEKLFPTAIALYILKTS